MADETIPEPPTGADAVTGVPQAAAPAAALNTAVVAAGAQAAAVAATIAQQEVLQEEARAVVVDALKGDEVGSEGRQAAATAALEAAPKSEKQTIAKAVVDGLDDDDKKKLVESMLPLESNDRKAVYIAGFAVATVLALGFGLIAAMTDNEAVATAAIAAALSLPSSIIGGLMGALTAKS